MGKYTRLAPVALLGALVSLVLGALYLMPDLYEVVVENTFAAAIFSNNLLKIVTAGNYWDVFNNYNPLMHYWYLGVIFQFYIILPILLLLVANFSKNEDKRNKIQLAFLSILAFLSLILYILPYGTDSIRFYGLHYRIFELLSGGLIAILLKNRTYRSYILSYSSILLLIFVVFSSVFAIDNSSSISSLEAGAHEYSNMCLLLPASLSLILVVLLSCVVLQCDFSSRSIFCKNLLLSNIGIYSYSIYIWHQIILGFERSFIENSSGFFGVFIFIVCMIIISFASYNFVEKKIQVNNIITSCCIAVSILVMSVSFIIYKNAGVVKDFPELEITVENAHNGMYGEYCDRVYQYDKDFKDNNNKIKCLFVGNSFTRDFVNILLESKFKDSLDISYSYDFQEGVNARVSKADFVFIHYEKNRIPLSFYQNMKKDCIVYGIGTKNFGESNSPIFASRNSDHYFEKTQRVMPKFLAENIRLKKEWGDYYIDLLSYAMTDSTHVRVFTDDKKIIARDCRHLTQAGARWYAHVMDLDSIFKSKLD